MNDHCDGAVDLGLFVDRQRLKIDGTTIGATNDSDESPWCGVETKRGVWYKLTIAFPAEVEVNACNSYSYPNNFQVAIYSGTCGSLICEADIDRYSGNCSRAIRITENSIPSDVYVRVECDNGNTDSFLMEVSVSAIAAVSQIENRALAKQNVCLLSHVMLCLSRSL